MVKTVTLNGAETHVTGLGGYNAAIRNDSSGAVYASANPNIKEGADGVLAVKAGASAVYPDCGGEIYLVGTGEVTVMGKVSDDNPFRSAPSQGGVSGLVCTAPAALSAARGILVEEVLV